MIHTKYQCSMPCGFRQEYFSHYPYISLCKTCDPGGGTIFGPNGHNLDRLGKGPLDDATNPNIKALGLVVSDKKIFKSFHIETLF